MYAETYHQSVQDGKIVLWEIFLLPVIKGDLKVSTMKSGIEYMTFLADWYPKNSANGLVFPNWWYSRRFPNVVPMLYQDMEMPETPFELPNFRFNYQLRFVF
jgi:hypothetical protein